ncbi:YceI family protein [Sulfurovum sp. zt1-1]|uniref:YceI family protein n=1 Tax=Sulfurovum zhangzhouensis TaxID=3019067 RepID=A0ABT7QZQ6_9BACT|nr:YceI family protein [Sulfurovum zhangzhouensis]MDM5272324.1 YceI family protein [Sulfurovum zhangzhouensis]
MKKSLVAFFMMSLALFGYEVNSVEVGFTAFKTPAKVGVNGSFNNVEIVGNKSAESIEAMLTGLGVNIQTKNVNSGNEGRDKKLVSDFFLTQFTHTIQAKIVSVKPDAMVVEITMNNKTLSVPMVYKVEENKVIAKGYIDLGDFDMLPSLMSINKACYDLHAGKTWQDVEVGFLLNFQ